jgi:hypothetical protein
MRRGNQKFGELMTEEFPGVAAKATSPSSAANSPPRFSVIPQDQRKDLATALLKHGEDKDDPMIPLLIWYGIEPVVAADPAVGMQLAKVSKMPKVTEFIYRRLSSDEAGRTGCSSWRRSRKDAALRSSNLLTAVVQAARGMAARSRNRMANWTRCARKWLRL